MKRSSEYFQLKYLVQCQSASRPCFETIAAFDSDYIAQRYEADCRKSAARNVLYRTMKRDSKGKFKPI